MAFVTRSRRGHAVFMFDVGHGDCVLITDSHDQGLLVDCGAQYSSSHFSVPQTIENFLSAKNSCGLVVSHYHWDHYSLFRLFRQPDALFSTIYLPDLPIVGPGRYAALAVKSFLCASVAFNFRHYRILPEIFTRSKRPVVFCKKGVFINEAGLHLRVLWPDLYHLFLGTKRVVEAARIVVEMVERLLGQYGVPIPSEEGENYSMQRFFSDLREMSRREISGREKKQIHHILREVEQHFRGLADVFSIVFRTHRSVRSKFLFLGDVPDDLLDQMSIPGNRSYDCIKTAHHGTRFGAALKNMEAEFVLVSRSQREFPGIKEIANGYITDIGFEMLLNTEFLHDCYIY